MLLCHPCCDTNAFQKGIFFHVSYLSAITKMLSALVEKITDNKRDVSHFLQKQTSLEDLHSHCSYGVSHIFNCKEGNWKEPDC